MDSPLDSGTRRFLVEQVPSVATLEMLLLMHASRSETWSTRRIATELRVDERWAASQLESLARGGLLAGGGGDRGEWAYQPRTPELDQCVIALAKAYLLHRVSVIEAIYSRPSAGVSAFADAFHLKRRPPDG